MSEPIKAFRFDVAFSFAGPHRDKVRAIAEIVGLKLGKDRVFFDEWYEHEILGDDMDVLLQRFYHQQSLLVVADLSETYAGRPWCQAEARAIRALRFTIDTAQDDTQRLRLLNTRFASGNVPGVFDTTGQLDGTGKNQEQCAEIILKRLALLQERILLAQPTALISSPLPSLTCKAPAQWPTQPLPFRHGMADRTEREWPAILSLLTHGAPKRILMFKGPSLYSKSTLLGAAEKYAKILHAPRAYLDFNDSALLREDNVLLKLRSGLGSVLPKFATDPSRWKLSESLLELQSPALILLDAYEKTQESKELVEWIEAQLLAEESEHLRFIIGGQSVPDITKARWRDHSEVLELDRIHDQRIWRDWVHEMNPNVDEKHVEGIVLGLEGVPGNISTALKTCAKNLNQPI